jgi:GNAT superfamily N-acetyltransferase
MSNPIIRKAHLDDYEKIARLHQQISDLHINWASWNFEAVNPSYNLTLYRERLEDAHTHIFVVEHDDSILAYAICELKHSDDFPILKKRSWLFIKDIVVEESVRWKWIGTLLLEHSENFARKMNLWSLELWVWSFNTKAIEFYKNKWFEEYFFKMRKKI